MTPHCTTTIDLHLTSQISKINLFNYFLKKNYISEQHGLYLVICAVETRS